MKRWTRRIGWGLAGLAGLAAVAVGVLYAMSTLRLRKQYEVPVVALPIPTDAAAIARGEHLARTVSLCVDCHGGDLGGKVLIDDPAVGRMSAPNLTPAGRAASFTDADWVRAIRHGVRRDGRPLAIMPADLYTNLADADLAALIAYLKQVSPVERELPSNRIGPLARFGLVSNKMPLLPAEHIDHGRERSAPAPGVTAEYGRYLASIGCAGCHGEQMKGKSDAFHDVPDVTPHGRTAGWSREQFIATLRTGLRPDRSTLSPEKMPWPLVGQMTDDELSAIYEYLQQLDRRVALQDVPR